MNPPDELYYDLLVTNLTNNNTAPPIAKFSETRTLPILKDTTDYSMSIIRFSLDTSLLPVFLPTIQLNQSNINLTNYSVTLSYTDNSGNYFESPQTFMIFQPQDLSAILPSPPSSNAPYYTQDNSTGYYFVYNYAHVINLMNQTLSNAYTQLKAIVVNSGSTDVSTGSFPPLPEMTINNTTNICSISSFGFGIYFNQSMYELFATFPCKIFGYNASNGKAVLLTNYFNSDTLSQEQSSIGLWNPVISLVFTTSMIPIVSNQIGNPLIYNEGVIINNSSNANSFNIITDLIADNFDFTPFIIYEPSAQYRFISLQGGQELKNIDVQVFWQSKNGNFYPLRLAPNGSLSMKILFAKKISSMLKEF